MMSETDQTHPENHRIHAPRAVGAAPGTLTAHPDAAPPTIDVMCYGPESITEPRLKEVSELGQVVGTCPVTWINIEGLGSTVTIGAVGEVFDLHRLALEDVINLHQRPKIEEYPTCLFIVLRMPELNRHFTTEQVSLFLGANFVVTFQERTGDCFEVVRDRIRKARGHIRERGADYLAYSLMDAVVDGFFPVLEEYGERLEVLEEEIAAAPSTDTIRRIQRAKRDLLAMRRAIWPQRELLNTLVRDPLPFVTDGTRIYLRDAYDHTVRIMDLVESYRELGSGLTDFYMSSVSNRMNEIMKVLTIIATIFIPLTFIAGIYGMNFNPDVSPFNLPELNWYLGYPFAIALMAILAILLVIFFKRKGWIGFGTGDRDDERDD